MSGATMPLSREGLAVTKTVTLCEPLPDTWYPALWNWVHEHPEAHLDDTSPLTEPQFRREMSSRVKRGERTWGVEVNGYPAGAVGYVPLSHRVGMLHGVCISRAVSGCGVADTALSVILTQLAAEGVQKVSASYFAGNRHIRACLKRLGFVDEGFLKEHTTRNGVPVGMWLVAKLLKGQR